LTPDSPADLVAEAAPLATWYLDRFRNGGGVPPAGLSDAARPALSEAQTGLTLLAPTQWPVLRDFLQHPSPFIRWTTLQVAEAHRSVDLVPDVLAYAQAARTRDDYGHWAQAVRTLAAMRATAEVDQLRRAAPPTWPIPRTGR
jgi:hypothetical protein